MPFEHYIRQGGKRLRCGYTTGTCAALAAKAAARTLLSGSPVSSETIRTPKGLHVTAEILELRRSGDTVSCAVRKDGGDDIDVTDGILIFASVSLIPDGLVIEGGEGVGRVTLPGLDQPVGAPAINSVPRRMIGEALSGLCAPYGYSGGFRVTVSVPSGAELAGKTFNPQLGITGGISILGTSGIVEPQSLQALLDSLAVEMRVLAARGARRLIITPGNYGRDFLRAYPALAAMPQIKCANFIGDTLDLAAENGMEQVLLTGHIGKMVKLAGGIMNTHSRTADCRTELFAAYAALCGAPQPLTARLMRAATSDACIELLDGAGLRKPVLDRLTAAAQSHLDRRAAGAFRIGLITFSNRYGLLTVSHTAEQLLNDWGNSI